MELSAPLSAKPEHQHRWLSMPVLLALWLLVGGTMVWGLGLGPLERRQEARVLEVGREMLGSGFQGWMIPHANGKVRLHKPPLAYWAAAAGYKLFGVSLWSGRLVNAIACWVTPGVVF